MQVLIAGSRCDRNDEAEPLTTETELSIECDSLFPLSHSSKPKKQSRHSYSNSHVDSWEPKGILLPRERKYNHLNIKILFPRYICIV